MLIQLGLAPLVFALAVQAGQVYTLHLRDSSVVVGDTVVLGDIGSLEPRTPESDTLLKRVVASGLVPRTSRVLSPSFLTAYCLKDVRLQSSPLFPVAVRRDFIRLRAETLATVVEAHVLSHMPWEKDDARLEITRHAQDVTLPKLPYELKVECGEDFGFRGAGRVKVDIYQKGKLVKTVGVGTYIELWKPVCVAARRLNLRQTIEAGDIQFERMKVTALRNEPFTAPESLYGKVLRRSLRRGRILEASMIETPALVLAGSSVRLIAKAGNAMVAAEGVARAAGRVGEEIPVFCPDTRKTLRGRVQASGDVVLSNSRGAL